MSTVILRICPTCGATGKPHWSGNKPQPPNTANDGVMIRTCGINWFHGSTCKCNKTMIYCYKCSNGIWKLPLFMPNSWLFFDAKENYKTST